MIAKIATPPVDLFATGPVLLLAVAALALLVTGSFLTGERNRTVSSLIGLGGFAGAALWAYLQSDDPDHLVFSKQLSLDRFSLFVQIVICLAGVASVLAGWGTRRIDARISEYYALLLFAGSGMCLLASANGFVSLFVALELFSISLYVLCALAIDDESSLESGLKYVVTGSVGSAFLLFGSALVYGGAGTLRFDLMGTALAQGDQAHQSFVLVGIAMVVAGLAFKASAAPFHMWTPDVYEGAPTAVTAFMATATKTIALATMLRVLVTAFDASSDVWTGGVGAIAMLSMIIGNLAALRQRNAKRMLAYSSVGHAGYLLIGVVAHTPLAGRALLFYLAVYTAMNAGAFCVLSVRERELGGPVTIDDLRGLGRARPLMGAALALFLLSLASFPPTGGFLAKLYLFSAAIDAGVGHLAIVGVIGTMISLGYYLRFALAIYQPEVEGREQTVRSTQGLRMAALGTFAAAAVVLWLGVYPAPLLDAARVAASSLALS